MSSARQMPASRQSGALVRRRRGSGRMEVLVADLERGRAWIGRLSASARGFSRELSQEVPSGPTPTRGSSLSAPCRELKSGARRGGRSPRRRPRRDRLTSLVVLVGRVVPGRRAGRHSVARAGSGLLRSHPADQRPRRPRHRLHQRRRPRRAAPRRLRVARVARGQGRWRVPSGGALVRAHRPRQERPASRGRSGRRPSRRCRRAGRGSRRRLPRHLPRSIGAPAMRSPQADADWARPLALGAERAGGPRPFADVQR